MMKINKYIAGSILVLAIVACVVPGLGQSSVPPTFDPNSIPTMVVLTANAAISQTAAAQSVATEIPADSLVPALTGTAIEQTQDGSTKYSDYDGGFEITFPAGWLTARPNTDEFNAALANEGADNQMLHDQMTADQAGYEANYDRLYSYILRPDIDKDVIFGYSKTVWDSDYTTPIDDTSMGELVRGLESSGAIPGFRADTAQVSENNNGVKMMKIGGRFSISDGQGGNVPFYTTIIFFKPTPTSGVRVTFSYVEDFHAQISTDVDSVIESIKIIEPQQ